MYLEFLAVGATEAYREAVRSVVAEWFAPQRQIEGGEAERTMRPEQIRMTDRRPAVTGPVRHRTACAEAAGWRRRRGEG